MSGSKSTKKYKLEIHLKQVYELLVKKRINYYLAQIHRWCRVQIFYWFIF